MGLNKRLISSEAEAAFTNTGNFAPVLYTGNNSTQSISSLDFQPDFVWIKSTTDALSHVIHDVQNQPHLLIANGTNALITNGSNTVTFTSNGFDLQGGASHTSVNGSGENFIAWCWKGGGAAVSGSSSQATNVTYSANSDAGFSIVKFRSSSSTAQPPPMNYITHGLNSNVEMTIYKRLDSAQNWVVQHKDLDQGQSLSLNLTNAVGTPNATSFFDNTSQSGKIGVRSNFAISRDANYIAYCFHSVDGYQKIGTYTATGSAGSPTVTTGFQPRFVMVKNIDKNQEWIIVDYARNNGANSLQPNSSNAENTTGANEIDFNADGFTIAVSGSGVNYQAGDTFIYLAIA